MEKKKKGSVIQRAFKIAAQGKGLLVVSCLSSILGKLASVVPFLSVYFIAKQLLAPVDKSQTREGIYFWVIVAGVSIVGKMVLSFVGSYGCHRVAFKLLYNFRIQVMEHIGHLPIGFFSTHSTGSVQKTMDENIEKIEGFVAHMMPDILGSLVILITLFGSLFLLNPWLAIIIIVVIVFALKMQLSVFGGEQAQQLWQDVARSSSLMMGSFAEFVKGIAEVKLFGLAGRVTKGLEKNIDDYRTWEQKNYKRSSVPMSLYKTLILGLLAFVLPVGILLIMLNPAANTLLAVLMALIIAPAIYDPLMTCINYGSQMGMLAVGLDAIDEILETPLIPEAENPQMPASWAVEFQDVTFSYQSASEEQRKMALDHLSFTAKPGSLTALVGPSGGGKSTVAQLLSRFWDVESGAILIGGIDIRQISTNLLMDKIALVLQDTFIFSDTIWGNLTMNRPFSQTEVEEATKAAQCHDFISSLPDGYQTKIGSGGNISLSGGEAQRLAIARVMLKDSPIIVLDEALAYSDAENENLIQRAIKNLVAGKTVIIIAHRLQSIKGAKQIFVMKDGQIAERGTHETLMEQASEYRTLWQLQHEADAWSIDLSQEVQA